MEQEQFLDVVSPAVARERWHAALRLGPLPAETVFLARALGRVLAEDVISSGDVPSFDRSNLDGFAVRAEDTFGASERVPRTLRVVGAPIGAGTSPEGEVSPGVARAISTGGMLPRGADAVLMVEDSLPGPAGHVRAVRSVAPGAGISHAGSDVARGETILRRGTLLTPRETGTLAACGVARLRCVRRPRVAVVSTGDEVVPPGAPLEPGRVHDANATLLADSVREMGGEAEVLGIVPDDEAALRSLFERVREGFDVVLLSGGTSKGTGDLSYRVLAERARIVVHGVALKPGKPLCLAEWDGRPVAVLPGFPTSAIFTFFAFVAPVIRSLLGVRGGPQGVVAARVPRRVASERGRAEFMLVNLVKGRTGLVAFPTGKGSGSVTTFARADGFFEIPPEVEIVEAGAEVAVTLMGREVAPADVVVVGSHCVGLDMVVAHLAERGLSSKVLTVGSRGGLDAARLSACDVAPVHLFDSLTGRWNEPFLEPGLRLLRGYGRAQGLAYRAEDAARFEGGDVEAAFRRAAGDPSLRLANRNLASGTRVLIDLLMEAEPARPPGWSTSYRSHTAVAAAIAQGRSDYGICQEQAARAAGLSWRKWKEESYDFLVPEDRWDAPGTRAFREALADPGLRSRLREAGFSA